MKWSNSLIPTLRENPADAELESHRLMLRAGLMRKLASGIYAYLPLAWRSIRKVEAIIREEMEAAGAAELHMPLICPSDLWKETNRWDLYGDSLWKVKDRGGNKFCLGPTHEEVITDLIRRDVNSYRKLPINLYQIQTKIRDEVRPRFGLMRAREFIMKDAYSFHAEEDCLDRTYRTMYDTYGRIFSRCGLNFKVVEADTGSIGGSSSHEFMILAQSGEDAIANCTKCDYAANTEKAASRPMPMQKTGAMAPLETVDTPGAKTIADLEAFFKTGPERFMKTLVYIINEKPVMVVVRADYDICEPKLSNLFNGAVVRLASDDEIFKATGVPTGFLGPVGMDKIKIVFDNTIKDMENGVTGANEKDKHHKNVNPGRDFKAEQFADLRVAKPGDFCEKCGAPLEFLRGIEAGHIFKLGTKYSKSMGANFLDAEKKSNPMIMGCYGIGVTRIVAAAIEQNHDGNGIIWPAAIAPYQAVITCLDPNVEEVVKIAEELYNTLREKGMDVLLDNREERPGVKFKDADLVGFPVRANIGNRGLKEGIVEVVERKSGRKEKVKPQEAVDVICEMLKNL